MTSESARPPLERGPLGESQSGRPEYRGDPSRRDDHDQLLDRFLGCILPAGLIETRLIEDRKHGQLIERQFFANKEDCLRALPNMLETAKRAGAGVFFGVLPRRDRSSGRADNTLPGLVAWADIDFRDFDRGEAEARERLRDFPLAPAIIVHSGHGLHVYWLLREPTPPEEIASLAKQLARALGGDHCFDAARILRLPGTYNRKDPEKPIPVKIEILDAARSYNPSEIAEALNMLGNTDPEEQAGPKSDDFQASGPLHPRLLALLDAHSRLRALFEGTGKPELDRDGRRLDASSSGYDFSLGLSLARKGISDRGLLANAILNRPDQAARAKGMDYVERTVNGVLERVHEIQAEEEATDFVVEKLRIFGSDPPVYEITIEGRVLRMSSGELRSPRAFEVRFMNALRRIPELPAPSAWGRTVNAWLTEAEIVEQPPEASDEHALREAVEAAVENLSPGSEACDLDHGKALTLASGLRIFKCESVLRSLKEDFPALRRQELCRVLRELGFEGGVHTVDGRSVRAWQQQIRA